MKNKKQNFLTGAFIIGVGGVIAKLLGVFFRIPVQRQIGEYGMGIYATAYSIYSVFLTLSTVGLPTAISKLVSERVTLKKYDAAYNIYTTSRIMLLILGCFSSLCMFLGAGIFANLSKNPDARYTFIALSPAPLFVSLISCYRGYFQGIGKMTISSLSQIIEQFFRVAVGVFAAYSLYNAFSNNIVDDSGISFAGADMGAAGATFGATCGAALSFVFLVVVQRFHKRSLIQQGILSTGRLTLVETRKEVVKKLLTVCIPIAAGSIASTIMSAINAATVNRALQNSGLTAREAMTVFGMMSNTAGTFINVPIVLGAGLAISLVPTITESMTRNRKDEAIQKISLALKAGFLVSIPAAVGLAVLASPIINLFFAGVASAESPTVLSAMAPEVIFSLGMTSCQAVLQALGYYYKPVKNLLVGIVVKTILNILLVAQPDIRIYGAVFSNVFATFIIFALNYIDVRQLIIKKQRLAIPILRIIFCSAVMGMTAYFANSILSSFISERISVLAAIAIAMTVYFGGIYATKAVSMDEIRSLRS